MKIRDVLRSRLDRKIKESGMNGEQPMLFLDTLLNYPKVGEIVSLFPEVQSFLNVPLSGETERLKCVPRSLQHNTGARSNLSANTGTGILDSTTMYQFAPPAQWTSYYNSSGKTLFIGNRVMCSIIPTGLNQSSEYDYPYMPGNHLSLSFGTFADPVHFGAFRPVDETIQQGEIADTNIYPRGPAADRFSWTHLKETFVIGGSSPDEQQNQQFFLQNQGTTAMTLTAGRSITIYFYLSGYDFYFATPAEKDTVAEAFKNRESLTKKVFPQTVAALAAKYGDAAALTIVDSFAKAELPTLLSQFNPGSVQWCPWVGADTTAAGLTAPAGGGVWGNESLLTTPAAGLLNQQGRLSYLITHSRDTNGYTSNGHLQVYAGASESADWQILGSNNETVNEFANTMVDTGAPAANPTLDYRPWGLADIGMLNFPTWLGARSTDRTQFRARSGYGTPTPVLLHSGILYESPDTTAQDMMTAFLRAHTLARLPYSWSGLLAHIAMISGR
jgi:hypothetical protein